MTLRPGEAPGRAIAVFPFMKTGEPVRIGSFTFKSTDDTTGLSDEDAAHVREVTQMLFLKDDLRTRSASYAILPPLDLDKPEPCSRNSNTFMPSSPTATVHRIPHLAVLFSILKKRAS